MRRYMTMICAGLTLTACASTDINPAEFKDSIRTVERASGTNLDSTLTLINAQADFDAERYDESYNGFQLIALKEPKNIEARIGWGNASIALNLFEKAYEVFSNT